MWRLYLVNLSNHFDIEHGRYISSIEHDVCREAYTEQVPGRFLLLLLFIFYSKIDLNHTKLGFTLPVSRLRL